MIAETIWFLLIIVSCRASCPTDTKCEEQFNKCYKFVDDGKSFFSAEDFCQMEGGHLVSLDNVFENGLVEDIAESMFSGSSDYWIGANRFSNNTWTWTDGSAWKFTNWFPGQSADKQAVSVELGSGLWISTAENFHKPFVCELPFHPSTTPEPSCPTCETCPAPVIKPLCEDGWVRFGPTKSCYKLIHNKNFIEAEQSCVSLGAHLASIHSKAENDFIAGYGFSGNSGNYTGMTWIGIYKAENSWYWTDNSPVDFTLWAAGEPDFPRDAAQWDQCGQIYTDRMDGRPSPYYWMWNDFYGVTVIRAAVCKKPQL